MSDCTTDSYALHEAACSLQIWGFPLIFAQRIRLRFTNPLAPNVERPDTSAGAALNKLGHQRRLSDHTLTAGVAPNVDTLYSLAFLDLEAGPFLLTMPDFGHRYYSVQICESDTTTRIVLGQRTSGGQLPAIHIGRRGSALEDEHGISVSCRTRFVMVAIRVLVFPERPDDSVRARALQSRISLTGSPGSAGSVPENLVALIHRERRAEILDPAGFLDSLQHAMVALDCEDIPPTVSKHARDLRRLVSDETSAEWRAVSAGLSDGLQRITEHVKALGTTANGWALNARGTDFGNDHLLRAAVAYSQIYINPAAEALYPVCEVDEDGVQLNGKRTYTITLEQADRPPAEYFWSITMYRSAGLLYGNEIDRYAITDRTAGLTEEDGRLRILIQNKRPSEGLSNWLPCPPDDFRLMLRLYGPTQQDWVPPKVVRNYPD